MEDAVVRLAREREELGLEVVPRLAVRSLAETVANADGKLEAWLRMTASIAEGVDARTAAAYLISIFVWRFDEILATLYLGGAALPHLKADDIQVGMFVGGNGESRDIQFRFHVPPVAGGNGLDQKTFERTLVDIHRPLVVALHQRTGLSQGALWRLVADGISGGFLAYGKRTDRTEQAMETARNILGTPPFRNAQWTFIKAEAPQARSEWFRLRGGCCRLYLTAGADYCTTCVLRRREDQIARLQRFIADAAS